MNIAMLGSGNIGGALGTKWAQAGHHVRFGVRDVHKPQVQALLRALGENASASSLADAIAFGEVVVFAIPGMTMDATIAQHAQALDGKIIIDTANKVGMSPMHSLKTFAAQTPRARVYRGFNNYGWENFEHPDFDGVPADLFYCGTPGDARPIVEQLIADAGLRPIYLGGVDQAGLLDDLFRLWFTLVRGQGMSRHLAFKVLTT